MKLTKRQFDDKIHSAGFKEGFRNAYADLIDDLWKVLVKMPSTHYPIPIINGKKYYYLCKEEIIKNVLDFVSKNTK